MLTKVTVCALLAPGAALVQHKAAAGRDVTLQAATEGRRAVLAGGKTFIYFEYV